jgi:hypothetical protein
LSVHVLSQIRHASGALRLHVIVLSVFLAISIAFDANDVLIHFRNRKSRTSI